MKINKDTIDKFIEEKYRQHPVRTFDKGYNQALSDLKVLIDALKDKEKGVIHGQVGIHL